MMRKFADRTLVGAVAVGAVAVVFRSFTISIVALVVGIVAYVAEYTAAEMDDDADR